MGDLPRNLRSVDPVALRAMADHLSTIVTDLRAQAAEIEAREATRREIDCKLEHHKWVEQEAAQMAANGAERSEITDWLSGHLPHFSVDLYADLATRGGKKLVRERRNLQIIKLARKGFSDADIADRVDLHPSTVNRIVRAALKGSVS